MASSNSLIEYMNTHPYCEACSKPAHGKPHHIKHRGAGGTDDHSNLLRLCYEHHYGTVHGNGGIRSLIEKYPHLYNKVIKIKYKIGVN